MRRYYFHVQDDREVPDRVGTELPSSEQARKAAVRAFGEMLADGADEFVAGRAWRMWVVDEAGETICTYRFAAECAAECADED